MAGLESSSPVARFLPTSLSFNILPQQSMSMSFAGGGVKGAGGGCLAEDPSTTIPPGPGTSRNHQLPVRGVARRELIILLTIATVTIPSITIATGAGNCRPLILLLAGGTVCRTSATPATTNVIRGDVITIPTAEQRQ